MLLSNFKIWKSLDLPTTQRITINDYSLKIQAYTLFCGKFPELKSQTLIYSA